MPHSAAVTTGRVWLRLYSNCCCYNIPKQPITQIDSFYLTNHLSHPSHPSHLITNGPRPSHPRDILKIKKGIFQFLLFFIFQQERSTVSKDIEQPRLVHRQHQLIMQIISQKLFLFVCRCPRERTHNGKVTRIQ